MALVTVEFDARPLISVLEQYERAGKNLRDAMGLVAEDMVSRINDNFDSEGAASPLGKWDDLKEATIAARRKKGAGAMILQDSGAMAGSIDREYGNLYAEAYTNDPKAPFHTSDEPREIIPLRDFMSIDLDAVQDEAAEDFLAQIAGH